MKRVVAAVFVVIITSHFVFAQEENKIDSLSNDVIQSIYKDVPENIDSLAKKSSFNAYPYAFYTPESKLAFGAGGIFTFYTGDGDKLKPSKIGFGGYYSTNNQYKISMNNTYYFANNDLYFHLPVSFGYFVNKYWGIGNNTAEYADASYTMQTFAATLTIQLPPAWFAADRSGIIIDFDNTSIVDKQSNLFLQNDSLPGSNGGQLIGIGTDLVWDSRDNIFFPNSGG